MKWAPPPEWKTEEFGNKPKMRTKKNIRAYVCHGTKTGHTQREHGKAFMKYAKWIIFLKKEKVLLFFGIRCSKKTKLGLNGLLAPAGKLKVQIRRTERKKA